MSMEQDILKETWMEMVPWLLRLAVVIGAFCWIGWRGALCVVLGGIRLTVKR